MFFYAIFDLASLPRRRYFGIQLAFSNFEFKNQQLLIETLRKTNSKRKIEKALISEDWIENYSIMQQPFQKKIFIRIKSSWVGT